MGFSLAGVAQLVERQLPKLNVDGSNPFTRFHLNRVESRTYGIPRIGSGLRLLLPF